MAINNLLKNLTPSQKRVSVVFLAIFGALLWFIFISNINTSANSSNSSPVFEGQASLLDCTGTNQNSPLCEERQEALEKIKILQELKSKLNLFNAKVWAVNKFQSILDLEKQGDKLYKEEFFGKSKKVFMEAILFSEDLLREAKDTINKYNSNGFSQLNKNDWRGAEDLFRKALLIDPADSIALKGLSRSLTLEEVLKLITEAKLLIKTDALDEAKSFILKAFNLDKENFEAQDAKNEIDQLIRNRDLRLAVEGGYNSLNKKDFLSASKFFNQALIIDKNSIPAITGLKEVKEERKREKIRQEGLLATEAFNVEDFERSILHHKNVLAIESNISFAVVGLRKANDYLFLEKQIDRYLGRPARVSSSAVYEEAKEVLKLSESYLLGERLLEKKVALTNLLDKYSQLKSLIINSNNRTYITIKNGKDLGLLSSKEVRLLPGTYTLIGKRKGYATVRKVIKLMEASSVSINCNDKI